MNTKSNLMISLLLAFAAANTFAQSQLNNDKVEMVQLVDFHISKPLSELFDPNPVAENIPMSERKESEDRKNRAPQTFVYKSADGIAYGEDPAVRQTTMGTKQAIPPLTNWAGQYGGSPPDPTGAVSTNYYVQAVNFTLLKIFNKTTGAQVGSVKKIGDLWSPATRNDGDPIVLYDKYADRWFLSQLGYSTGNYIYIAISTTNDPTGTYYAYTFTSPGLPDYLKFSIWWDGYYMTSNSTPKMFCFERNLMLAGSVSARGFYKTYSPTPSSGFFSPLPGDADGQLPSSGTPCPIFMMTDNAWGSGANDGIEIFKMTVNWVPATPTATIALDANVALSAFDASYDPNWNDISQPGTTNKLDGLGGILTFRTPWRKWTGYNSVVLNFGVKLSSTQRSIRWCELRQDQGTGVWTLKQEGTYAPDSYSRWVGSIAMDDNGSIALCYAKSGASTVYPSLAYTGRLATDALGAMSFAETIATAGITSQLGTNRFGDYSHTSLDPSDGLTFWHTGEYILGGKPATRIYSFKLPVSPIGIEESQNQPALTVYQSGNQLHVKGINLGSDDETVVDLFDITGRQIAGKTIVPSSNSLETSFDVSGLAQGTYILRIGRNNTSFQKVTKVVITQ